MNAPPNPDPAKLKVLVVCYCGQIFWSNQTRGPRWCPGCREAKVKVTQ